MRVQTFGCRVEYFDGFGTVPVKPPTVSLRLGIQILSESKYLGVEMLISRKVEYFDGIRTVPGHLRS